MCRRNADVLYGIYSKKSGLLMTFLYEYRYAEERFDISFDCMIDYVMFWHKHMMISLRMRHAGLFMDPPY